MIFCYYHFSSRRTKNPYIDSSLKRPLFSVAKVTVVESFDCTLYFCHWLRNWIQSKNSGFIFSTRDLHAKQIAMGTSTMAVMDAGSREEYVIIASRIAPLSKRHANGDYGVFLAHLHCFCCY